MINYNLEYLLYPWISKINILSKIKINGIKLDSRLINKGDLFIAIVGNNHNGENFISQAINFGAVAVLINTNNKLDNGKINIIYEIPVIYFYKLLHYLSALSGRFYQQPANKMKIIGITGTNGKTTIAQLIAQWLYLIGKNSAFIGTIGNGIYGKEQISITKNTTDSAIEIQKALYEFLKRNTNLVTIEVSSHGLVQHRVASLPFEAVVFSNLTEDHLDYHHNMKEYENAKWLLFSKHNFKKAIINYDDLIGRKWLSRLTNAIPVSLHNDILVKKISKNWLYAEQINYNNDFNKIKFKSSWGNGEIKTKLIGKFNISNLLISLTTLLALNYSLNTLVKYAFHLNPVCGRMEFFKSKEKATIVVDYAHTPDAIKKVLSSLKENCKGKLWCLFGCGGNRDKNKRSLMGNIVEKIADVVIITNDNPRDEHEISIIKDIISGFNFPQNVHVITNRVQAINYAFNNANFEDIILIAGKGHENYQIIGKKYIKYSDQLVVKKLLE